MHLTPHKPAQPHGYFPQQLGRDSVVLYGGVPEHSVKQSCYSLTSAGAGPLGQDPVHAELLFFILGVCPVTVYVWGRTVHATVHAHVEDRGQPARDGSFLSTMRV